MGYIVALDQGTTSSRAIVFDQRGQPVAVSQKEFPQHFPRPGWIEHDPLDIWSSQVGVMSEALSRLPGDQRAIAAVGITNQRETTVVWDRQTGRPILIAIVWEDRRSAELCDQLKAKGLEPLFRQRTGLVLDAYFSGTKIRWILDHVEGARDKANAGRLACGTVDSWLVWQLTEGQLHITDATNASRYLVYDIHRQQWDDELLEILDIPRAMLPEVRPSSQVYGRVSPQIIPSSPPIAGIAGDQQAALFGQACTERGMAKNTYGTGCFLLMNTGDKPHTSTNNLISTVAWRIGDHTEYALEGSIFVAGALVQWLRDGLRMIRTAADVENLARQVDSSDGVYVIPAFAGIGAPHWDPYARGAMIGLTRGTLDAHIARAALEAIGFQTVDVIRAMENDTGIPLKELRVDGGAVGNNLLMQIQADLLGAPVVRPVVQETTALGAAYLAGLATGYWGSSDEIATQWQVDRRFEPTLDAAEARTRHDQWLQALERAKGWAVD
ncbi:MAG: glycerol kinase GlpK [Candidatus Competibacterales bacterium]